MSAIDGATTSVVERKGRFGMILRNGLRSAAAVCLAGGALLIGGALPASAEVQSPLGVITLDPNTAIADGQTITLHAQRLAPETLYTTAQCSIELLRCDPGSVSAFTTDSNGNATVQVVAQRVIEVTNIDGQPVSEDCRATARRCSVLAWNDTGGNRDTYAATLTFAAPK